MTAAEVLAYRLASPRDREQDLDRPLHPTKLDRDTPEVAPGMNHLCISAGRAHAHEIDMENADSYATSVTQIGRAHV